MPEKIHGRRRIQEHPRIAADETTVPITMCSIYKIHGDRDRCDVLYCCVVYIRYMEIGIGVMFYIAV